MCSTTYYSTNLSDSSLSRIDGSFLGTMDTSYFTTGLEYYTYSTKMHDILENTKKEKDMCNNITVNYEDRTNEQFDTIVRALEHHFEKQQSDELDRRRDERDKVVSKNETLVKVDSLIREYNNISLEIFKLEDYKFIAISKLNKKRKNIEKEVKLLAEGISTSFYKNSDLDYIRRRIQCKLEENEPNIYLSLPKTYTTTEIKARLYLTKDWEDKSFTELIELIKQ